MHRIKNSKALTEWINKKVKENGMISSIKGPPIPGMTYEDGTPILTDVNIAWYDPKDEEMFYIEYEILDDITGKPIEY